MSRKLVRTAVVLFAVSGAFAPAVFAKILIVSIGAKTGEILDTEWVDDGKADTTIEYVFVPGK